MVQWLRLPAPYAEDMGSIPSQATRDSQRILANLRSSKPHDVAKKKIQLKTKSKK